MKYLVPVMVGVVLWACGKKEEQKAETLSVDTKTFRVESAGGCKTDTIPCAYYEVNYPVINGLDTAAAVAFKKQLDKTVSMGNPEAEGKTMEEIGNGFIKDFEDFKKEMPESATAWNYKANSTVEVLTDTLISVSVQEEYYTGGAHGGYGVYFINLDPRTGSEVTLTQVFKEGFEEPLRTLGDREFRKARELADTANLNANYFEFPDNKFQLNKNFGFKKEGIVFYFNSYEVAAYAAGPTEVLIPYEELKDWLKR